MTRVKPPQYNFSLGEVGAEWHWFWHGYGPPVVVWMQPGNLPVDIGPNRRRWSQVDGSLAFDLGTKGAVLAGDGATDYVSDSLDGIPTGTAARTVVVGVKMNGDVTANYLWGYGGTTGGNQMNFRVPASGRLRVEVGAGNIVGVTNTLLTTDFMTLAIGHDEGADIDEAELYIDGVREAINSSASELINTTTENAFRLLSAHLGGSETENDEYFVYIIPGKIPAAAHAQIGRDPFGPMGFEPDSLMIEGARAGSTTVGRAPMRASLF